MKAITILMLAICLTTILSLSSCGQENKPINSKGFAVLELFTSEGCSSCPPADKVLAEIQAEVKDKPIYVLAYHVDYWNRLGWNDVFSDADFTTRQKQYRNWLNTQIYTPQLVVNGKAEFVGSEKRAIRSAVEKELKVDALTTLILHAQQEGEELKVHYITSDKMKNRHLLIAIVQKNAQTKVERGENAGYTLSHVQIVRKLQNVPIRTSGEGRLVISLSDGFDAQNWEVLGIIQDQSNGQILGATKADLKP